MCQNENEIMMIHRSILDLFTYWDQARGPHFGPLRSEIEPQPIKHLLTDLFILERQGRVSTFRLAGTRLCASFNRELRGEALTALFDEADRPVIARLAIDVMEQTCPVLVDLHATSLGGQSLAMSMALLPVRSAPGRYDRLVGALVSETRPGWLGAVPLTGLRVLGSRALTADGRPAAEPPRPQAAAAPGNGLAALFRRLLPFSPGNA